MSGQVVDTDTGELVQTCSAEEARELTDQIQTAAETTWHLIKRAYVERAWEALGYTSWDDYCTREFGTQRLSLPREERREVVGSLREAGLSTRAIAAATGNSQPTITRDIAAGDSSESPEPEPEGETPPDPTPTPITGRDGKSYQPPKPKPSVQGERDPELTKAEQRERDKQQAIRRDKGRLEQLINSWGTLRSLPDSDWRDEILDSLIGPDRDKVLEIESIYLKGVGRE